MQTVCCIILGGQIGDRGRLQFTGSASALVSASEQAPRAPRLYAVLSWRSRERGAVGSPLAGASRVKGGACGCRSPEEWSVAEFLGGRTSGALTLRRARAAQSAVCTRLLVSVQARARPEPCVARGRPRVLCVRVSVQAHPQHFRRFGGGDIVIHRQNRGHRQIANARWIFKWQRRAALRQEIRPH